MRNGSDVCVFSGSGVVTHLLYAYGAGRKMDSGLRYEKCGEDVVVDHGTQLLHGFAGRKRA